MANQIPLNTLTDAAGGILVPEVLRDALIEKVNRQAAALSLSQVERINSNRAQWPVYKGRPTVEFVDEGADKPITGAEFGSHTVNIKKIAAIVVYTEEMLEDARIDPQVLINDDLEKQIAQFVDSHMLGVHAGGADATAFFNTSFDDSADATQAALQNTTQTVELGASNDAFALALSEAMELVESNGYNPNGFVAAFDAKRQLRDARDNDGRPLYRESFNGEVPTLEGLRLSFSTNLDGFPAGLVGGAGSPGKTVGIVGDFSNSKAVIRKDISMRTSREAVVGSHNLFRQNKMAALWEMRMGYTIFDRDRSFVRIVNPT